MTAPKIPAALAPRTPAPRGLAPVLGQMAACSFFWASSFLVMKLAGADLSPIALTAIRGCLGGLLIGTWIALHGASLLPRGRDWKDWLVLGVCQGIVPNTLTAFALTEIAAGLAAMIQAATPLIVAALAHGLFDDERLSPRRLAGVMLGFVGMALLLGPSAFGGDRGSLLGVVAMIATAMSYALGNLYVRTIANPQPLRLAFGQQCFSGLPTAVLLLVLVGAEPFAGTRDQAVLLLLLGLFGTALPIVLYMRILHAAGPTLGSMTGYFTPIWTVLLGMAVLGESVSLVEICAASLVLAGVAIVSTARRQPRR